MAEWEQDRGRIAAALDEALKIPGVHTAYVGPRYRRGRETGEMALCVFVHRKKPLDAIAAIDRVPNEIAGIPTDVIESDPVRISQGDDPVQPTLDQLPMFDDKKYSQVRGGIKIEGGSSTGTLACVARATDVTNNGRLVILGNEHYLAGKCSGAGATVWQPEVSCCCCGQKIGVVLRTRNTQTGAFFLNQPTVRNVDCGIALLNPGIQCLAEIQVGVGDGTATELVRAVFPGASLAVGLDVKKRGIRTGQSTGTISSITAQHAPANNRSKALAFRNQITCRPAVLPGTVSGTIHFQAGGDSGAALMTADDRIAGLMWGAFPTFPLAPANRNLIVVEGVATPIDDVIAAMQIAIETTNTAGQVINVPAPAAIPAPPPGALPQPQPIQRSMLAEAQFQIEQTVYGRQYADTVRRHHAEVRALVATNRRVGAIWKRYGGQSVLQAILDAVGRPDQPIPAVIGARPLAESAARIAMILRRYGSAALVRDIGQYERVVGGICGCTYNQLLARLRAGEPVLS